MFTAVDYPEMHDGYYITPYGRTTKIENETLEEETAKVSKALNAFKDAGLIKHTGYDQERFLSLRKAVREKYEITWTSVTPPMERLLYAIQSIRQPRNVLAIGIFCGNTLTWTTGAASGPGKAYEANSLAGVEIEEGPAALARRNLDSIGMNDVRVLCQDGFETIAAVKEPIDLLYLDAFGHDPETRLDGTKRIYLSMLRKALPMLSEDAVVLAHDTMAPCFTGTRAEEYFPFVRESGLFRHSFQVGIDEEGIEVTFR